MLDIGKKRYANLEISKNFNTKVEFLEQNAEDLNLIEDNSIDTYTISFGIRNVPRISKALKEAYRVLKNGGMLYVKKI
jgi:ubiquinone/menaquinone biosynthesis C-methylase UbiE